MTRTEAIAHLIDNLGREDAVRNVRRDRDEIDDITWWTADVIDAFTGATVGHAQFNEHHGDVMVDWQ